MEKKDYIKYYELRTGDGLLYLYERYNSDKKRPVIREFFTGLEAERKFNTISFMEGKSIFKTCHEDTLGNTMYIEELRPYKFLERVLPFLCDIETISRKREEIFSILEFNADVVNYMVTKQLPMEFEKEQKDDEAQKLLKKYLY